VRCSVGGCAGLCEDRCRQGLSVDAAPRQRFHRARPWWGMGLGAGTRVALMGAGEEPECPEKKGTPPVEGRPIVSRRPPPVVSSGVSSRAYDRIESKPPSIPGIGANRFGPTSSMVS